MRTRLDSLEAQLRSSGRGDTDAFAQVYESMAPRVYGLALRILRDAHQAEEVTHEVFLQIWQTSNDFDSARGSARSWLLMIAHRRAVDRVRRSDAERRRDATDTQRSRITPRDETVAAAHESFDAQTVRTALDTLSTDQRQALELAYFGGFTHTEVSGLLQVPLGTAKSRIRDGLMRLQDLLEPVVAEPA